MGSMAGSYDPVHLYDVPGIAMSQFIDSEAGFKSIKDLFLSPDNLTPSERSTLADKFVGPQKGLSRALAEVVTNPWVWMMFIASPVGSKAMAEGGSFWDVNKAFTSRAKLNVGPLAQGRTLIDEFNGSPVTTISLEVSESLKAIQEKARSMVINEERAMKAQLEKMVPGGKFLDQGTLVPSNYAEGSKEYRAVNNFVKAAGIKQLQLDTNLVREVPDLKTRLFRKQQGPGGGNWIEDVDPLPGAADSESAVRSRFAATQEARKADMQAKRDLFYNGPQGTVDHAAFGGKNEVGFKNWYAETGIPEVRPDVNVRNRIKVAEEAHFGSEGIDQMLSQYGTAGEDLIKAYRKAGQYSYVEHNGDMAHYLATGEYRADPMKLSRIADAYVSQLGNDARGPGGLMHTGSTTLMGKEALLGIVNDAQHAKLIGIEDLDARRGALMDMLEKAITPPNWNSPHWGPRNNYVMAKVEIGGVYKRPLPGLDQLASKSLMEAPMAATGHMSDRIAPLTTQERVIDPDLFEWAEREGIKITDAGQAHWAKTKEQAQRLFNGDQSKLMMVLDPDLPAMHNRAVRNLAHSTVYDTRPVTEGMLRADEAARASTQPDFVNRTIRVGDRTLRVGDAVPADMKELLSPGALMNRSYLAESAPRQELIRTLLVPGALSVAGDTAEAVYNSHIQTKRWMGWLSAKDGMISRVVSKAHPKGKEFMDRMRELSDFTNPARVSDVSGGLAKWFYVTHLGINMGSMVMNMMQPFTLAATAGRLDEVVGALGDSVGEMLDYASKRAASGKLFISEEEKLAMMKDSFSMMGKATGGKNMLGIGPNSFNTLDSHIAGAGGFMAKAEDLAMKGFEVSEWQNRNFSAHLFKRMSSRGGAITNPQYLQDLHRFVLSTQFGANDLNTPLVFMKGPLANPLLRQFMSFPLRTAMGVFDTFPKAGGENYWKGFSNTMLRGMGMSALMYEAGKGMFGMDISRGLFASSATQLVGGDKLLEKNGNYIPIPPVIDVPVSILRGVANEDAGLLAGSIARVIPGGVALNKVLNISPPIPQYGMLGDLPGALQKTYARYDMPLPTGEVPVFKADGTLVEYKRPSELIAKSFGVDMGMWQQQGELDNYLVKQRDQIVQARHEYLRAINSNEIGRAVAIADDFQRRFKGVPLTVTKQQAEMYANNQMRGRTERGLERLPSEVRYQYSKLAENSGAARNLPAGSLSQNSTSTERDQDREGMQDQIKADELMRRIQAVGAGAASAGKGGAFSSFGGF